MKSLPPYLLAKFGDYRQPKETHVRITAKSCVNDFDIKMLGRAQPVHGYVRHIPSNQMRQATFTRLKIAGVRSVMLAHRVTGTLYRASDGVSSSPDLRAVVE